MQDCFVHSPLKYLVGMAHNFENLLGFSSKMLFSKAANHVLFLLIAFTLLKFTAYAAVTDLKITEFMASNSITLKDDDGDYSDWIEVFNAGTSNVNVEGLRLTDDAANTAKWTFPSTVIDAGKYLVVFASSKNRNDPTKSLHTNFALSAGGEYLGLYHSDGTIISEFKPQYPAQSQDKSYGINSDGALRYFSSPTPGSANGIGDNPAMPVTSNFNRGFYTSPITVVLATAQTGGQIRYTLNGSDPTATSSLYNEPIQVSTTTVLRAVTFASGFQPSTTQTFSFIFLNDVIKQPATIVGFPNNHLSDTGAASTPVPMDMAMDPAIVASYSSEIVNSMTSIPTISLVASTDDIFGESGFYFSKDDDVERKVSVEVLYADGSNEQIDGGAEAHSHDRLKRSLRLNFRSEYGTKEWKTNIIRNGPLGSDAITTKHRTLVLRGGNNRCWARSWNPDATAYTEDEFYRKTVAAVTGPSSQGTFVHLYLNGVYWGVYNLIERPDNDFAAQYFKGDKDSWFYTNHGGAGSKTSVRWDYLKGTLASKDMSIPVNYEEMKQYLDVEHFADYILVAFWAGLTDWPSNNWYVVLRDEGGPEGPAPAKFMAWDGEWILDRRKEPGQGATVPPSFKVNEGSAAPILKLWHSLLKSPEFRKLFADRVALHTGPGGALTDSVAIARWDALNTFVQSAIVGESARWGDSLKALGGSYAVTRTRNGDWQKEVTVIRNLLNGNRQKLINELVSAGLFTNLQHPTFYPIGGPIPAGTLVRIVNPNKSGTIKYTTDGSDPRTSSSSTYAGSFAITNSVVIKATVFGGGLYSAVTSAAFPVIVLTELHYNPADLSADEKAAGFTNKEDFEFIELRNIGPDAIKLDGFVFTAGITLLGNATPSTINPGEYFVFVSNINAFQKRYGNAPNIAGVFTGSALSNGGEQIAAEHPLGVKLFDFVYDDISPWPLQADGQGPSLEVINPFGDLNDPLNWRASQTIGGTPGKANDGPTLAPISPAPTASPSKSPTATAAPVSAPTPVMATLTLINADTDKDIGLLTNGMTISLSTVGSSLNIRANSLISGAKSVVFFYDGTKVRVENSAPFSFAGDTAGNYSVWTPSIGSHTVIANCYDASGGTGTMLSSVSITFSVTLMAVPTLPSPKPPTVAPVKPPMMAPVNSPTMAPVPPTTAPVVPPSAASLMTTLVLINANTDSAIGPLTNGMNIKLNVVGTSLNIQAETVVPGVKSIVFFYDGVKFRTESTAPFAFAGDTAGNYLSWTPTIGTHTVTATCYSATGGNGNILDSTVVSFTVSQTRNLRSR
jgi:hypothetical protein